MTQSQKDGLMAYITVVKSIERTCCKCRGQCCKQIHEQLKKNTTEISIRLLEPQQLDYSHPFLFVATPSLSAIIQYTFFMKPMALSS